MEEHNLRGVEKLQHQRASQAGGNTACSSQYLGIVGSDKKWQAKLSVTLGGQEMSLFGKIFESETDAAKSYDRAVVQWHGR